MFKINQYDAAIEALKLAREQHVKGTHQIGCGICGDSHGVDECGMNPLLAMRICEDISKNSNDLHEVLHQLSGYRTYMGETSGPARVSMPKELV